MQADSEARPWGGRRDRVSARETGWRRAGPCGGDVTVFIGPKPDRRRGSDGLGRSCADGLGSGTIPLGPVTDRLGSGAITLGPVAHRLGSGADRLRGETLWGQARPYGGL